VYQALGLFTHYRSIPRRGHLQSYINPTKTDCTSVAGHFARGLPAVDDALRSTICTEPSNDPSVQPYYPTRALVAHLLPTIRRTATYTENAR
jgi:hypothetical protein